MAFGLAARRGACLASASASAAPAARLAARGSTVGALAPPALLRHQLRPAAAALSTVAATGRRGLSAAPEMMVGAEPAPSAKQLQFAYDLSQNHNTPMPDEAKSSSILCSAFIEQVLDDNPSPPTEKQLAFLSKLCAERGTEPPPEVLGDRRKASTLIDELLGNEPKDGGADMNADAGASATDPSPKQIILAARLARDKGEGIPADALASKAAMSTFLERLGAKASTMAASSGGGGWQPEGAPPAPSAPYPPPLDQRDENNRGRYPY